ncbi:protein of unknown function [Pseudomonas sp. JV551A1]|uniref:Uncharacterized protein n=1 Tax=Pseudomonas inefficax TaxID=2078786 RepID=A0AAQ1P9J4_9PSED|nr:protein of unknown function [Pseudomonas sp. JV551A1]SPO62364.1 protein of unknown function [Pseudomonas inefficax]
MLEATMILIQMSTETRTLRQAMRDVLPAPAFSRARPLPQDLHGNQDLHSTCGSGRARERASTGSRGT